MTETRPTLDEYTGLKIAELDDYDIAVLNLFAARGLPGTDDLDVSGLLETLDEWAERVKFEICRHLYRFEQISNVPPGEYSYGNSIGRFFCWYMLQVLQEDCGVAYHPDRKFDPDFCNPEDLFIHGIVDEDGKGGTCASMPVVYVAVARRLGLPAYLVQTRGHLFFRWDSPNGTTIHWEQPDLHLWLPPERFNVEGSGEGIAFYADSHYIQWPELWKERDFDHGRYLRSMTAKEELADFLVQRAECWRELGNWAECDKAIYYALQLEPDDKRYQWLAAKWAKEFQQHEDRRLESIREMDEMRRKRLAEAKPAMPGHAVNCKCPQCHQVRKIEQSRPTAHGPSCRCRHCSKIRAIQTQQPTGVPGHGPTCACANCQRARTAPQPSHGGSAFPVRPHQPGLPLPGTHRPNMPHPGQPPGLPGF